MARRIVRRRSPIHGNGVFAATDIISGAVVTRHTGKLLTHHQANRRYGNDADSGHTFLFTLNDNYVLDTNDGGNIARWINHSCAPNCRSWVVGHASNDPRRDQIVIEAVRDIREGEELAYDYQITLDQPHTARMKKIWACRCGSPGCSGTILKPKRRY